jgi:branched-chain amino acid transport system ATP-binding protein
MSVRDNLLMGSHAAGLDRNSRELRLKEVIEMFPVLGEKLTALAAMLSGGQKQLLLIARALMGRPKLLMLDEPSLGLAPLIVRDVFRGLMDLRQRFGLTIVLAEQNARNALRVADRGYVLSRGELVAEGSSDHLRASRSIEDAYFGKSL